MERIVDLANGTRLCIDEIGDPQAPLVLQIEGHMAQLISTPESYCERLAEHGFRVVRVDNRDIGRSSRFPGVDYRLRDMAADVHELLRVLGSPAVVCGRSMGGAIAQLLAIDHPDDVLGLGLFYTYAKSLEVHGDAPPAPFTPAPFSDARSFFIWERSSLPAIAGSQHPYPPGYIEWLADTMWARGVDWEGFERQRRAMGFEAPWAKGLAAVDVPTVIVHGDEDPVVPVEAGRRLHTLLPGSDLRIIEGLGHQQPEALDDVFVEATLAAAGR
ncbi:MAG: alpha/beta hydrolase [Dermatophilus congolensis]|nr:alpha/beta hydrolase [Dermatophilus congolensis]